MRSTSQSSSGDDQASEEDERALQVPTLLMFLRTHWRRVLVILLWLGGACVAFKLDISALQLYIILTVFYLIFTNLGERRTGPSAYSVFNRNCEPIMGQLNAEQFDNEVRHRAVNNDDVLSNIATSALHNLIAV